jgi:hypothetical protein
VNILCCAKKLGCCGPAAVHEDRKVSRQPSVDTHTWSVTFYGGKVGLYDLHVTQADVPLARSPHQIEVRALPSRPYFHCMSAHPRLGRL